MPGTREKSLVSIWIQEQSIGKTREDIQPGMLNLFHLEMESIQVVLGKDSLMWTNTQSLKPESKIIKLVLSFYGGVNVI